MAKATFFILIMTAVLIFVGAVCASAEPPMRGDNPTAEPSPAAELTRGKLLRIKVSGVFKDVRLGDVLKELSAQVETRSEQSLMWTYEAGFPFQKWVTFSVKDQPLDETLGQLLTRVGDQTGFVVVSSPGDKYDGWVRLTINSERGKAQPPPSQEEEAAATERLALAKKLIDSGMEASAKPLLEVLIRKYATTKAGREASTLLMQIDP